MNKYTCIKCKKNFSKVSNFKSHINRKYPCVPFDSESENSTETPPKLHQNPPDLHQPSTDIHQNSTKIHRTSTGPPPKLHQPSTNSSINPKKTKNNKDDIDQDDIKKIINQELSSSDSSNIIVLSKKKVKKHKCEYCEAEFSRSDALKRHLEGRCKEKKEQNTLLSNIIKSSQPIKPVQPVQYVKQAESINNFKEIKVNKDEIVMEMDMDMSCDTEVDEETRHVLNILLKQNKQLLNEINLLKNNNIELNDTNKKLLDRLENLECKTTINTINNTQNNTLNNNIILAHGSEDFSKVDLQTVMNHLTTINFKDIIPNMTKHIYINDNKPENKNFCVLDMSRNKCTYWNGKKWVVGNTKPLVDEIFNKVHNVLTDPFEKDNIHKTIEFIQSNPFLKKSKKFIDFSKNYLDSLYDENDKENIQNKESILSELKYIFYNNREEILKLKSGNNGELPDKNNENM